LPRSKDKYAELGMLLAGSWTELGELMALANDDAGLKRWREKVAAGGADPDFIRGCLTVAKMKSFISTTYALLQRKFEGKSIASDVKNLIAPSVDEPTPDPVDHGSYLQLGETETVDAWWATEYTLLFAELAPPVEADRSDDWMRFAGKCAKCGKFFVKQRSHQLFDSSVCRQSYHNTTPAKAAATAIAGRRRRRGHP
jgi:hypothetical protein